MVREYGNEPSATLLDLGCSIGTYAIEFALDGYKTIGLDLDAKALDLAEKLAKESGCKPEWICADAGSFGLDEPVDIIICFDLLEHLEDKIIKGLLISVKDNLKHDGVFIYHTFPLEYDHIFYNNLTFRQFTPFLALPLIPFRRFSDTNFTKVTRYYSALLDIPNLVSRGKTYKKIIADTVHPNPLSKRRLLRFFRQAGLEVLFLKTGISDFNPLRKGQGKIAAKYFSDKSIAQRSIWGVAKVP